MFDVPNKKFVFIHFFSLSLLFIDKVTKMIVLENLCLTFMKKKVSKK
jgi:lipoprotein signal peptidase